MLRSILAVLTVLLVLVTSHLASTPVTALPATALSAAALSATGLPAAAAPAPVSAEPAAPPAGSPGPVAPASVLLNELANGSSRSASDGFVELRNWGAEPVALDGWKLYRCTATGLRVKDGAVEADLGGRTLAPGELLTISRVGMPGALHTTSPYAATGFGLWLESPSGIVVDRMGVYPNEPWPTTSECSGSRNLPNVLDASIDESWQRVGASGDPAADWLRAPATVDAPNATSAPAVDRSGVVISEFAAAGSGGSADDLVELRNDGGAAVDVGGWRLFRCTAEGRLDPGTLQLEIPAGTVLAPGALWLAGGPGFDGRADARYAVSLADSGSGVLLRTDAGLLADRIAMSSYGDSACQSGDSKLEAILDPVADESWQRGPDGWIVAPRTPGAANAREESSVFRAAGAPEASLVTLASDSDASAEASRPRVAISEIATDPGAGVLPSGLSRRNGIEIANYGGASADIGGWTLRRCTATGARATELQATVPAGTALEPGAVWTAALAGTDDARLADAEYDTPLNFLGTGVWLADADGARVDGVGVYGRNELDASIDVASPCTTGLALTTFAVDRMRGETFQRVAFSGSDADDFRAAAATPGRVSALVPGGFLGGESSAGARAEARTATAVSSRVTSSVTGRSVPSASVPLAGTAAPVLAAWSGASAGGPLVERIGAGETALAEAALADASAGTLVETRDDGYGFPYQRFELDATGLVSGGRIGWSGASTGRNEVQLSVWSGDGAGFGWRLLDAAGSDDPASTGAPLALSGALEPADLAANGDGTVTVLVQNGPRTAPTIAEGIDGRLQDQADYDLAIAHVTDTQYLSEAYPEVYADELRWIARNADARRIAFATHTGDLIQNWVDPDQSATRARAEFARASAIQSILDDAGVPNSVLPGNHDNKRGTDGSLFNEYFGPGRYADEPWYGGSIAPDDNSASAAFVSAGGADFLFLALPYAYGEREIAWAERMLAAHPDRNVIVSTHEHLSPSIREQPAHRSSASRWLSRADELWDRVIAPNRSVVAVLSGHFHGLGRIVTEDAGGLPGHDVVELLADYQEFRTHTGERSTGFQRLLQLDLASGTIAVDTFSLGLDASASYPFDYGQFLADSGDPGSLSNDRPWNLVEAGLQHRYDAADDEFTARVSFQYAKLVATTALTTAGPG